LSGWYKRSEFGLRASIFFSAATASGAFGGLLSAAIHNMEGVGGYTGWRWIFILIGLATVICGVLSIWFCQDFPDTAGFLSEEERAFVVRRLEADQKYSAAGEGFQWSNVIKGVLDWKTWVAMIAYMGVDGPLYAFRYVYSHLSCLTAAE
jgi:sugar phosphate permease